MALVVEPSIKFDDIEFVVVENQEEFVNNAKIGRKYPIIKLNGFTLNSSDIYSLRIDVSLNTLPHFHFMVLDEGLVVSKTLTQKDYDTCTIFLGFKNFYVKFDGLVTSISGDEIKSISGFLYTDDLFTDEQKIYDNKSILDILKELCTETKFGLFTFDNQELNTQVKTIINPGKTRFDFISEVIKRYTTNIFSYDTFGVLHVGDVASIYKQPIDKFKIEPVSGDELDEPKEIIFSNDSTANEAKDNKPRIKFADISIESNFGRTRVDTPKKIIFHDEQTTFEPSTTEEIGLKVEEHNVWSGFSDHKKVSYSSQVNKMLNGTLITIETNNIIFELVPFSVVGLEIFLPSHITDKDDVRVEDNESVIDTEHSGKRIVIGYSYLYDKGSEVKQRIKMI